MRNLYQLWQIHILLENEMLKNAKNFEIGPCLDIPIGPQRFVTYYINIRAVGNLKMLSIPMKYWCGTL